MNVMNFGGGGGSAGTEPLDFGMETLSTETAQSEAETVWTRRRPQRSL